MKPNKFFTLFLIFLLSVALCFAEVVDKNKVVKFLKKISEEITGKSLIRKDLLFEAREKLNPPRRNIFSPRNRSNPEIGSIPEEVQRKLEEIASTPEENPSEIILDIRYIGYIDSGHKIVALIFFGEETLAVEEGEIISEEIRVGKVSPREIEIIGPDSIKRKYSLEGEGE